MTGQHIPATIGRRTLLQGLGVAGLGLAGVAATAGPASAAAHSQNGYPVIESSSSPLLNRGFTAAGVAFPNGVRKGNVTTILGWVAVQFNATVEKLQTPGCWGWSVRDIRGSSEISNHASGTAIDLNAPQHPLGSVGTFGQAQQRHIAQILAFCEGVVAWGGNYNGRKDEMHFEIASGVVGTGAVERIAAKVLQHG